MTDPTQSPVQQPAQQTCSAFDAASVRLAHAPVDDGQLVSGIPTVGLSALREVGGLEVGVWEHTTGTSTDVEADEVFVVVSGRASVEVQGGPTLELSPGTVGVLTAGARTTWTVHETLRKVYVVPAAG